VILLLPPAKHDRAARRAFRVCGRSTSWRFLCHHATSPWRADLCLLTKLNILWYRKRRQELLEGWEGLVEDSDAKNGANLLAWMDEVDRLNPGLFCTELEIG